MIDDPFYTIVEYNSPAEKRYFHDICLLRRVVHSQLKRRTKFIFYVEATFYNSE